MSRIDFKNSNLEKKLGAYALAGAAMFAAPVAAKAEIQYVAVNQTFTSADAVPGYFGHLSDPNATAFGIGAAPASADPGNPDAGSTIAAFAANGGGFLADGISSGVGLAEALPFGAVIDPTNTANFGKDVYLTSTGPEFAGHWSMTGGDAYLGFSILDVDGMHSGWVHLATTANEDGASLDLLGYAYDTDTNTVITAGEGEVATPEPSSLALLVLGAAGLLAFRRRR